MLAATAGSNTSSSPICGSRSIEIRPRRGARNPNCQTNRQRADAQQHHPPRGKIDASQQCQQQRAGCHAGQQHRIDGQCSVTRAHRRRRSSLTRRHRDPRTVTRGGKQGKEDYCRMRPVGTCPPGPAESGPAGLADDELGGQHLGPRMPRPFDQLRHQHSPGLGMSCCTVLSVGVLSRLSRLLS